MIDRNIDTANQIHSSDTIRNYVYGGGGALILEGPSGTSHVYKFQQPNPVDQFPDDVRFVYALHEDISGDKLFYIGMVSKGQFKLTRHSRFLVDTPIVRGAYYIIRLMNYQQLLDSTPMKIYHNGRCCFCNKPISSAKSIELGYGRQCKERIAYVEDRRAAI